MRMNSFVRGISLDFRRRRYSRYEKNRPVSAQPDEAASLIDLRSDDDPAKTETLINDFKNLRA